MDDLQLLRSYVEGRSEAAFERLVERYLDMVWGVAFRITRNEALSKDVAQEVFTDLARRASTLRSGVIVRGWLHRATCFASKKAVRTAVRRSGREQAFEWFGGVLSESNMNPIHDSLMEQLDEALENLSAKERDALLLRFFVLVCPLTYQPMIDRKTYAAMGKGK